MQRRDSWQRDEGANSAYASSYGIPHAVRQASGDRFCGRDQAGSSDGIAIPEAPTEPSADDSRRAELEERRLVERGGTNIGDREATARLEHAPGLLNRH